MAINLLYLLGVVPDAYRRFYFMFARDVEMFIAGKKRHCSYDDEVLVQVLVLIHV